MAVFRVEKNKRLYRYEQPPFTQQGAFLKGKGLVVANALTSRRLGLHLERLIPYQPGEDRAIREAIKELERARGISFGQGSATRKDACGARTM